MAIKPTIYKFRINLSDLNRDYYQTLSLTVAQHPSETDERLMTRVLAYCLHADEGLSFTKGLSEVDEPDIWIKAYDEKISLWLDVGEPAVERVKKATRQAEQVCVYSFNSKSATWWQQSATKLQQLSASYYQFNWHEIESLAALLQRTMDFSVTITGHSAYIATADGELELSWHALYEAEN